jgi:hypothetical protein
MNTTPSITFTDHGLEVGVATARLLLKHALDEEQQKSCGEEPEVKRKRAMNELTGSSMDLPSKGIECEEAEITNALETDGLPPPDSDKAKTAYD